MLDRVSLMMRPQVVFVLGGPGAGKGTQCSKIVEVREMARERTVKTTEFSDENSIECMCYVFAF